MRMLAKLLRIQGVRRHQVGDREFRLLRPVDNVHDRAELEAIARLVRIRVRRRLSERQKLTLIQGRRPFRPAASEGAYAER
jgi:hypothetical protein